MKKLMLVMAVILALALVGCAPNTKLDNPEGAYRTFVKAIMDKNYDNVYPVLDAETQMMLSECAEMLVQMETLPNAPANLPGGEERAIMTKAAHADVPAHALITAYLTLHPIVINEEQKRGSEPDKVTTNGDSAKIITRGGEEIGMVLNRDKDGTSTWRVTSMREIVTKFKSEISSAQKIASVPPKTASTPEEQLTVLVDALKQGKYDAVYFMLDSSTIKELDEIAHMNATLVKRLEENPKDEAVKAFLADLKTIKMARTGKDVLVAVFNRFPKPGSVEIAGAKSTTAAESLPADILLASNLDKPVVTGTETEVTITTAAGETIRFVKETNNNQEGWHTDFMYQEVRKAADKYRKFLAEHPGA